MRKRLNVVKKDNKGFSLVELIIVMVVMAVLVGIVGMQVIPYIQKAQKAKDIQKVSGYCTDAMTAYMSCAHEFDVSTIYTITATKGVFGWSVDVKDDSGASCAALKNAFLEMNSLDTDAPKFVSKEGQKIQTIIIVCQNGKPNVSLTVTGPEEPDAFMAEAK